MRVDTVDGMCFTWVQRALVRWLHTAPARLRSRPTAQARGDQNPTHQLSHGIRFVRPCVHSPHFKRQSDVTRSCHYTLTCRLRSCLQQGIGGHVVSTRQRTFALMSFTLLAEPPRVHSFRG